MIDPENGLPIPNSGEAIQYRRAEKGWRYRDHERAWTQYIWGMIVTSQSIMLGIFAIIATRPKPVVSDGQLTVVVVITLIELCIFIWRAHASRNIDRLWAKHFEDLVDSAENKKGYDGKGRNEQCQKAEVDYLKHLCCYEWGAFIAFIATAGILLYAACVGVAAAN